MARKPKSAPADRSDQEPAAEPPAPEETPPVPAKAVAPASAGPDESVTAYFIKTRIVAETTYPRGRVAALPPGVFAELKSDGAVRKATPEERALAGV